MSDSLDLATLASHGGTAVLGAGGVGALMRWLSGRESQEVATQLALMRQQLDQLVEKAEKSEGIGQKVALMEASLVATHKRIDELEDRLDGNRRRPRR